MVQSNKRTKTEKLKNTSIFGPHSNSVATTNINFSNE